MRTVSFDTLQFSPGEMLGLAGGGGLMEHLVIRSPVNDRDSCNGLP